MLDLMIGLDFVLLETKHLKKKFIVTIILTLWDNRKKLIEVYYSILTLVNISCPLIDRNGVRPTGVRSP